MAFWNYVHNDLHTHVWLLLSIVVGIIMLVAGLVHSRMQKNRKEEYEKELRGNTPGAPAMSKETTA